MPVGSLTTEGDGVTSAAKLNSQPYFYSSSPTSLDCTVEVTEKVLQPLEGVPVEVRSVGGRGDCAGPVGPPGDEDGREGVGGGKKARAAPSEN